MKITRRLIERAGKAIDSAVSSNKTMPSSLWDFSLQAWQEVHSPHVPFQANWHHEYICEHLNLLLIEGSGSLIINIAPRHLKSIICSVFFPAYCWLTTPWHGILNFSYNERLSVDHNLKRRALISSGWYQSLQKITFSHDKNRTTEYENQYRASMIARGMVAVTGVGGHWLIFDDPNDPAKIESTAVRESKNQILADYIVGRRNSPKSGGVILTQQRCDRRDATWKALQMGGFKLISLPTVAPEDELIIFPISKKQIIRKKGDLLHPERFGAEEVEQAKKGLGSYLFSCRHQQNPINFEGGLFKRKWWQYYDSIDRDDIITNKVWAWDTAYKTKQGSDCSAGILATKTRSNKIYLEWGVKGRWEYPELKRQITLQDDSRPANAIIIEDAASGQSVIQDMKRTIKKVRPIKPDRDKVARAMAIIPFIESGMVFLPNNCLWVEEFLEETGDFNQDMSHEHDDWVDALVYAISHLNIGGFWGHL